MFAFQVNWDKQKAAARVMARKLRFGSPSDPSRAASAELPEADQFGEGPVLLLKQPPALCQGNQDTKCDFCVALQRHTSEL